MYTEASKRATIKYIKEHTKQIMVRYKKEEYIERIKPAIDKSGIPISTFIKQAILEKIERDGLGLK